MARRPIKSIETHPSSKLSPSTEISECLNEAFRCFICMGRLNNAHLCPHCSKLCCYECIVKWLAEQNYNCPYCRGTLNVEDLVNCRWLEDVAAQVENLQEVCLTIKSKNLYDHCPNHEQEKITIYCWTCKCCICHRCALWNGPHAGHFFKQLELIYENHVAEITKEISKLRTRLIELVSIIRDIQNNVVNMRIARDEGAREIRFAFDDMLSKLDYELKTRLIKLLQQKNTIKNETKKLDSLIQEVEYHIKTYSKSKLIIKSSELLQMINELQIKPIEDFITAPIPVTFPSEIKPKFNSSEFLLENFTQFQLINHPVFSEPLKFNGFEWRLKVYPNGNDVVCGEYLSVFIELLEGVPEYSKYEYRIKMLHSDQSKIIHREFVSNFNIGECWGYNRFFRLDSLFTEGYLKNDTLDLRFEIRQSTYYQKCRDQEWYIEKLLKRQNELENELRSLKKKVIVSDESLLVTTNTGGPNYNASDNTNDTNENEGAAASFVSSFTPEKNNQNSFASESENCSVLNCDANTNSTFSNKKELVTAAISKMAVRKVADYSNNLIDLRSINSSNSSNSSTDYINNSNNTNVETELLLRIKNNENTTNTPTDKPSSGNNSRTKKQTFKIDDISGITKNVRKHFNGSEGEGERGNLSNSNTLKLESDGVYEDNDGSDVSGCIFARPESSLNVLENTSGAEGTSGAMSFSFSSPNLNYFLPKTNNKNIENDCNTDDEIDNINQIKTDNANVNETSRTDNFCRDDNQKSQKRHDKQQRQHKHLFRLSERNVINNIFSSRENGVKYASCNRPTNDSTFRKLENSLIGKEIKKMEEDMLLLTTSVCSVGTLGPIPTTYFHNSNLVNGLPLPPCPLVKPANFRIYHDDPPLIPNSIPGLPLFRIRGNQPKKSWRANSSEDPCNRFDRLLQNIQLSPESKREIHPSATEQISLPSSSSSPSAPLIINERQKNLDRFHGENSLNFFSDINNCFDVQERNDHNNSFIYSDRNRASNVSTNRYSDDSTSSSNEYQFNINNDEKFGGTTSPENPCVEFCIGERDLNDQPPSLPLYNIPPTLSGTPISEETLRTLNPPSSAFLSFQHNQENLSTNITASTPSFILRDKTSGNSENVTSSLQSTLAAIDAVGACSSNNGPTINNSSTLNSLFKTNNSKISNSENRSVSSCPSEPSSSLSLIRNASLVVPSTSVTGTKKKSSANETDKQKSRKKGQKKN